MTSRLVSLPRIMAVALRANVQFCSIATGRSRGPVGKANEAEGERGASRRDEKIFTIKQKEKNNPYYKT